MQDSYKERSIFVAYFYWHYSQGLRELFGVLGNFLWFITNFFSFSLLLKTLFAPWKRMGESYGRGLDINRILSTFVVNSLMRLVGFVIKFFVLLVGLIAYVVVTVFGLIALVVWLGFPVLLLACAVLSFSFFIV